MMIFCGLILVMFILCFFRSRLLHWLFLHLTVVIVIIVMVIMMLNTSQRKILSFRVIMLHLIIIFMRSWRQGSSWYPDLVRFINRGWHGGVILINNIIVLPPLVSAEHQGRMKQRSRTSSRFKSKSSFIQRGTGANCRTLQRTKKE